MNAAETQGVCSVAFQKPEMTLMMVLIGTADVKD